METSAPAFGFRFDIPNVVESTFTGGESGYIIYLVITNTETKARPITVSKANYVTKSGEQLEQDKWLTGTLIESGKVQGNAQRKCGLLFYKPNLKSVSTGDTLHIEIGVPDRSKKLTLRFEMMTDFATRTILGVLTEMQVDEWDDALPPEKRLLKNEKWNDALSPEETLLKKVERLEAFEERAGVRIEGLCVRIFPTFDFEINGELYPREGLHLSRNVEIVFTVYGKNGEVLETESSHFFKESFYAFEAFSSPLLHVDVSKVSKVAKIRVYPKIS